MIKQGYDEYRFEPQNSPVVFLANTGNQKIPLKIWTPSSEGMTKRRFYATKK